eukprot:CAMPEP_0178746384 /NCGR_PEP_ID=MMETSP0744-20121128/7780_1 /TAXON_ID=913974 /ORGANISM="Nitzschia punctata, Strain CCMP561" /LENGTH=95 /DNA_ID=CAMNT_0020399591 /DNA_START=91 /DNA_END=378 /DNA_ORIENTATION=+
MENLMNQIPENIMKHHDPNDDPFAALADDSSNELTSPLEYGSGISYFVNDASTNEGSADNKEEGGDQKDKPEKENGETKQDADEEKGTGETNKSS